MVTFLRKTFIKDYGNVSDPKVRAAHGVLSSLIGLLLNAILVGLKLTGALLLAAKGGWVFSMALLGDATNNLFDFSSCLIALFGFRVAEKPADDDHPYGHQRAEYVAGLLIGIAIIVSGAVLLYSSLTAAIGGEAISYDLFALLALGLTLPIKGFQCYLNLSLGKILSSPALKGVGIDALSDCAVSSILFLFALLSPYIGLPTLDAYLGIFLSAVFFFSGGKAIKEAADPLLGDAVAGSYYHEIEEIANEEKGVLGVHDLIVHAYGQRRYCYFHIEVDGSMSLKDAHDLADRLERRIAERCHCEVSIHVDPREEVPEDIKKTIEGILSHYSPAPTYHDIHIRREKKKKVLRFDVLLPFGFEDTKKEQMEKELEGSLSMDVEVVFDHPYHAD